MPNPYPITLRERAVRAYETSTETYADVAARFSIGLNTLLRWVQRTRATGDVSPFDKRGGWQSPVDFALLHRLRDARARHRARRACASGRGVGCPLGWLSRRAMRCHKRPLFGRTSEPTAPVHPPARVRMAPCRISHRIRRPGLTICQSSRRSTMCRHSGTASPPTSIRCHSRTGSGRFSMSACRHIAARRMRRGLGVR